MVLHERSRRVVVGIDGGVMDAFVVVGVEVFGRALAAVGEAVVRDDRVPVHVPAGAAYHVPRRTRDEHGGHPRLGRELARVLDRLEQFLVFVGMGQDGGDGLEQAHEADGGRRGDANHRRSFHLARQAERGLVVGPVVVIGAFEKIRVVGVVGVGDRLGYVALAHEPRLTLVVRGEPQVERFVVRVGDLYERHPPPEEVGAAPGVEMESVGNA